MEKLVITPNTTLKEFEKIHEELFKREFLYGESKLYIQYKEIN